MNIKILHMIEGARKADGLTVIIDVFRAFSLACYLFEQGADKIIPVGDIELAYRLHAQNPDYILVGERNGRIQPGFDYGNSPSQILNIDFTGKTVIHTTSAGTQGIANAAGASEIITGSLVNAGAIVRYINRRKPGEVSLVCMGNAGKSMSEEDTFCAGYIKSSLEGKPYDMDRAIEIMKETGGKKFFDPANSDWGPQSDFYLCTDINRFHFILKVEKTADGLNILKRINMEAS
jgi:2-phosphosulfolactate phosphatase